MAEKGKASEMRKHAAMTRIGAAALEAARIAAGYTGESVAEYVTRVVEERATADADRMHAERSGRKGKPRP